MVPWKIYELFDVFANAGAGHPSERFAAYELARIVPDLMMQNERMKEQLRKAGVPPKVVDKVHDVCCGEV